MKWTGRLSQKELDAGARFRAVHSSFLTRAFKFGLRTPRIPAKPVEQGGFSTLKKLPEHEKRSTLWWAAAMNRMDDIDP
ncbi:MAG: hypothetical protein AB8C13_04595 [Phycisphaerales bacterium]